MHPKVQVVTRAVLALAAVSTLAALPSLGAQAPTRRASDEGGAARQGTAAADGQAIRALSQQWLAAERRRDSNAYASYFADDAVTVYDGQERRGRDAIRKYLEEEYARADKQWSDFTPSWVTTSVTVSQAGDLAYETGVYDRSWNGGRDHDRGHYLTVWRKVGGQWKVARDMATPERPSAQASAAASAAAGGDADAVRRFIESAYARMSDAIRRSDTAAVMRIYADDAIFMWDGQRAWRGKEEFLREFPKAVGELSFKDTKSQVEDVLVSGDLAVETGTYENTMQTKSGQEVKVRGKHLVVWKRQFDGSWKIMRDMGNDGPPARQ